MWKRLPPSSRRQRLSKRERPHPDISGLRALLSLPAARAGLWLRCGHGHRCAGDRLRHGRSLGRRRTLVGRTCMRGMLAALAVLAALALLTASIGAEEASSLGETGLKAHVESALEADGRCHGRAGALIGAAALIAAARGGLIGGLRIGILRSLLSYKRQRRE